MKFREIFRFELARQLRSASPWLYGLVLASVAFLMMIGNYIHDARNGLFLLNSPVVIAAVTVFGSLLWLLIAAPVAGIAAARDVEMRMHALTYTTPVSKAEYLGGRFLAAFVLNATILLAVPLGILIAIYPNGVETEILGPFRPATYLTSYLFITLPNAFAGTAIQFSLAALKRRAASSYVVSVLLFFAAYVVGSVVAGSGSQMLASLVDPIGIGIVLGNLTAPWSPMELNTRLVAMEGPLVAGRLLWLGIALGTLALTFVRFRFAHPAVGTRGAVHVREAHSPAIVARSAAVAVPRRTFGLATHVRQTAIIAWTSFRALAASRSGLFLLAIVAALVILIVPAKMEHLGVPMFPRTEHVLSFLTASLANPRTFSWTIIPLLTVFYAGELVWREREAGLSEIAGAAPVPEWVLFVGKFLGLALVLVAWTALLTAAGMLSQVRMGYHDLEAGLYLKVLFGIQLTEYLLFALLALVVHVLVDQKYLGYLAALVAYGLIAFASTLGIEHNLLVYGAAPAWSYTDMRGFGPSLGPWMWFKLYWAAWALLLAVAATLLWGRGREKPLRERLHLARRRFTGPAAGITAAAVVLIVALGGFVFYNTNVLNEYRTASDRMERRADYERHFERYEGVPQPRVTGTRLHVEIYPARRAVDIRGTYRLVNQGTVAMDTIHLSVVPGVETGAVTFDRPAARVPAPEDLGHRIYALARPLQPGDSLRLGFRVRSEPRGFANGGADAAVAANGTYFRNYELLPYIGYQASREIDEPGDRSRYGLPPRPAVPPIHDAQALRDVSGLERTTFDAVVGTDADQVAVAPGALRRTWTERGRRYFHYTTDAPIRNESAFVSADYAVHEARWKDVAIQIFHHPGHTANLDRMASGVRASLEHFSEQFGPYPYSQIRLVEHPGEGGTLHAAPINIAYQEGFSRFNPGADPRDTDFVFAVVAHEVAHQWWGNLFSGARVEGSALLSESLAWYSAMQVVEEAHGPEHLRKLLDRMREAYETPRTRAGVPLLRATGWYPAYRKGPFALYALSEYVGRERVNGALRSLLQKHASPTPPLPTTLDLYRELRAATPDSLQYLLHDLFAANTFWELETERAAVRQTAAGTWQVTLDVRARKVVVDSAGLETPVPMNDWVEIGVFTGDKPLYLWKHRIRSGAQRITVAVPARPSSAGIDPRYLLIDVDTSDNIEAIGS